MNTLNIHHIVDVELGIIEKITLDNGREFTHREIKITTTDDTFRISLFGDEKRDLYIEDLDDKNFIDKLKETTN